jgi:hypothetical protein
MTQPPAANSQAPFSGLAIAAFVVAFFFSLLGLILGIVALVRIGRTGMRGRGLALAAVILGAVFLIFQIIAFAVGGLHFSAGVGSMH